MFEIRSAVVTAVDTEHVMGLRLAALIRDTVNTTGEGKQFEPATEPPSALARMRVDNRLHYCRITCVADRSHAAFPMLIGHEGGGMSPAIHEPDSVAGLGCWVKTNRAWTPVPRVMWGEPRDFARLLEILKSTPLPPAMVMMTVAWHYGLLTGRCTSMDDF